MDGPARRFCGAAGAPEQVRRFSPSAAENPVRLLAVRRASFLQLGLLAVIAAAICTAVAILVPWLPVEGSKEAGRIAFTYWFMTGISIFVFAGVAAVLVYAAWKFRVKDDDLSDGPPVHGHSGLEIAWTVGPFLLVTAVAVVSAIVLHDNTAAAANQLKVTATGQQFAWTFTYPNGKTYPVLRLPEHRQVVLTLESKDVLHSFWVPQFYQKQDAIPGLNTKIGITPTRLGTFPVICVELCGLGHSLMRSEAIVMKPAAYDAWYKNPGGAAGSTTGGGAPKTQFQAALDTFNANGCSACHTFTPAHATGKIGPDLDKLKEEAARAGSSLNSFINFSIIDPNSYVEPGYQPGIMPADFVSSIPAGKIAELVQYLAANTK
jgi:cytochrome c oxidase subunit 2